MLPETQVASFVLRFVFDELPENAPHPSTGWHGLIRHVQSGEERRFTRWAEAVAFVAQYVQVNETTSGAGDAVTPL